jgi:hypothetical protein
MREKLARVNSKDEKLTNATLLEKEEDARRKIPTMREANQLVSPFAK